MHGCAHVCTCKQAKFLCFANVKVTPSSITVQFPVTNLWSFGTMYTVYNMAADVSVV